VCPYVKVPAAGTGGCTARVPVTGTRDRTLKECGYYRELCVPVWIFISVMLCRLDRPFSWNVHHTRCGYDRL